MRFRSVCSATVLLLFAQLSFAGQFDAPLQAFFQERLAGTSSDIKVTVKTPDTQIPSCDNPDFSLPPNGRFWGNLSVLMRCGAQQRYLQVYVQANGNYLAASQVIDRGEQVTSTNVALKYGPLDQLPPNTLFSMTDAMDAIVLRNVAAGQPIMQSMLRPAWRVKAGQQVQVIAQGQGFSINSAGQALNNAAIEQSARVRMTSGQVVSGVVSADGNILINL